MKKHIALLALTLSACATVAPVAGTIPSPSGNVPLVQIQNDSYSEAVVFLEGVRFAVVQGSSNTLLRIPESRIASNGTLHFSVHLTSTDESANLPVVEYREGRKVRITIRPLLSASTAY